MVQGFYKLEFHSTSDYGHGVVILENGLVRGGDASYYYTGEYALKSQELVVELSSIHYAGALNNILGAIERSDFRLTGIADRQQMVLKGTDKNGQGDVVVNLTRIADITRHEAFESLVENKS